jgi:hypothetical protein
MFVKDFDVNLTFLNMLFIFDFLNCRNVYEKVYAMQE